MQNYVERLYQLSQMPAHGGAHAPADPVAIHCSAQNFSDGETHARAAGTPAFVIKSHYISGEMLPALLIHHLKISMLQQSRTPGEFLGDAFRSFIHG